MANDEVTDEAVIYQLEKVDQGGAIQDLFESRMYFLADEWGYEICEDEDCPEYGSILLPDGRHASLTFEAYITKEGKHEPQG
jgi:hypothetical protein